MSLEVANGMWSNLTFHILTHESHHSASRSRFAHVAALQHVVLFRPRAHDQACYQVTIIYYETLRVTQKKAKGPVIWANL